MDLPVDKLFFHYTTREAAFAHILPSSKLLFSTYEAMRDPLENRDWPFTAAWYVDPANPDGPEKEFIAFDQAAKAIRRQARLLAMTVDAPGADAARPFSRGWSRARMWEHYAEAHAGVCLVFDQDRLTENIVASVEARSGLRPYHGPVTYSEDGGSQHTLVLGSTDYDTPGAVARYIEQHKDELFFVKTSDWATEYEYRFVTTTEDEEKLFVDFGDALVAVIVGERFPDWERPAALAACGHAEVEAMALDWSMHRPIPITLRIDHKFDPNDHRKAILEEEPDGSPSTTGQ